LKFRIQSLLLIPSDGGRFELTADGKNIWSKLETGKFPDHDDILKRIEKILA